VTLRAYGRFRRVTADLPPAIGHSFLGGEMAARPRAGAADEPPTISAATWPQGQPFVSPHTCMPGHPRGVSTDPDRTSKHDAVDTARVRHIYQIALSHTNKGNCHDRRPHHQAVPARCGVQARRTALYSTGIYQNIREFRNVQTEERGAKVAVIKLKDIELPESIHRAMPARPRPSAKSAQGRRPRRPTTHRRRVYGQAARPL
jgi:hypothetical protein